MKRYLMLFVLATAAVFASGAAAGERDRLGERLVVFAPPATFQANAPFHIAHGWGFIPAGVEGTAPWQAVAEGKLNFTLAVDGELVEPSYREVFRDAAGILRRVWVHNFPAGLPAGAHTFTAKWWGPCASMVRSGFYSGPCATLTEVVVAIAPPTATVEFTP